MPDNAKNARGKRMNKSGAAARHAEEPLLGEAALKDALAGFGIRADASNGSGAAMGAQPHSSVPV